MRKKNGKWDTHESVLDEIWIMLTRGASRFNDPFHWPVLGTTGKAGPNLRTVILRKVIVPERTLVCHTDARAPKVQEIRDAERVSWLFYHPKKMIQLRITGSAALHTDNPLAEDQWAAAKPTSRLNYCAVEPPGTAIDRPCSGLPDFLLKTVPTILQTQRGRKNFMAIACRMDAVDWLILRPTGNRRACFTWDVNGQTSTWLVP